MTNIEISLQPLRFIILLIPIIVIRPTPVGAELKVRIVENFYGGRSAVVAHSRKGYVIGYKATNSSGDASYPYLFTESEGFVDLSSRLGSYVIQDVKEDGAVVAEQRNDDGNTLMCGELRQGAPGVTPIECPIGFMGGSGKYLGKYGWLSAYVPPGLVADFRLLSSEGDSTPIVMPPDWKGSDFYYDYQFVPGVAGRFVLISRQDVEGWSPLPLILDVRSKRAFEFPGTTEWERRNGEILDNDRRGNYLISVPNKSGIGKYVFQLKVRSRGHSVRRPMPSSRRVLSSTARWRWMGEVNRSRRLRLVDGWTGRVNTLSIARAYDDFINGKVSSGKSVGSRTYVMIGSGCVSGEFEGCQSRKSDYYLIEVSDR